MLNTNYIYADTQFGVIQRARPPVDWVNYACSQALYNWIDHNNNEIGLAFFGGGLADYELYEDGNGFAVTLIRSVGKLTNTKSHSMIMTPEAQCNRELEFDYAIYPHLGNWKSSSIYNLQLAYQVQLLKNQSNLDLNCPSLLTISQGLKLSSLKRSEDKENLYILRVYNPDDKEKNNCKITFKFSFKKLILLNLNEDIVKDLGESIQGYTFDVKPYQILTFGIEV